MKKIFLLLTLNLLLDSLSFGQVAKNEIYVGIGGISRPFAVDAFGHYLKLGAWGTYDAYGTYHLGYKRHITPRLSVGLSYMFETQQHHTESSGDPMDKTVTHSTNLYHTLLADITHYWKRGKWVHIYSGIGFGPCFLSKTYPDLPNRSYQKVKLAYQITPFGIRVGKSLGGYAEIGYGFKGVFCAGLSYHF